MSRYTPAQADFITQVAMFCAESGLPPSVGRVLGLLLICEPAHQSAEDIRRALGLSVGSVNIAVNLLYRVRLVKRLAMPGSRRHYYRIDAGAWRRALEHRLHSLRQIGQLAEQGLALHPGNDRLASMAAFYRWIEAQFGDMPERMDRDLTPASKHVDQTPRKP